MHITVQPAPNQEREARVRRELQLIDPSLDIVWEPIVKVIRNVEDDVIGYEGRYALVAYYPPSDPMRQYALQTGRAFPYDRLGWFTTEVMNANSLPLPCDEMMPVIRGHLAHMDSNARSLKERMQERAKSNERAAARREAEYVDEAVQRALDVRRQAMDIPFVSQYSGSD